MLALQAHVALARHISVLGALSPATWPAPPPARYQHLSAAYSPITTETQRERQKGLARQVFEQDTSGDERSGPEDSVRAPLPGSLQGVCDRG